MPKTSDSDLSKPLLDKEIKSEAPVTKIITLDTFLNSRDFTKLIIRFLGWKDVTAVAAVNKLWLEESLNSIKKLSLQDEKILIANIFAHLERFNSKKKKNVLLNDIFTQLTEGKSFQEILAPLQLSPAYVDHKVNENLNKKAACRDRSYMIMGLCGTIGFWGSVALLITTFVFLAQGKDLTVLAIPAIIFAAMCPGCCCLPICDEQLKDWRTRLKDEITPLEYKAGIEILTKQKLTPENSELEIAFRQLIWLKKNPRATAKLPKLSSNQLLIVSSGKNNIKNKNYLSMTDHAIDIDLSG